MAISSADMAARRCEEWARFLPIIPLLVLLCPWVMDVPACDSSPVREDMDDEELRVIAAVVKQVHLPRSPKWFILADRTTTFDCDPPANTGLNIDGCSGMRTKDESPRDVLRRVALSIDGVTATLTSDLEKKAQKTVLIQKTLPLPTKQIIWGPESRTSIPKDLGIPDFAVYPSRVAFDKNLTRSLVYVGVVSWVDASRSYGEYVYLAKEQNRWIVKGRMRMWKM